MRTTRWMTWTFCLGGFVLALGARNLRANNLGVLRNPTPADLSSFAFLQPGAGVEVQASGMTDAFYSNLPPSFFANPTTVNIVGNFQAYYSNGNPINGLQVTGVQVTQGSNTFTPQAGTFNFDGSSSLTLTDSQTFAQVTFDSSDFTLAFKFNSDPSFQYSYALQTNLTAGDWLLFQDAETEQVPESSSAWLLLDGLLAVAVVSLAQRFRRSFGWRSDD